jgi:hypothetical protein
VAEEKNTQFFPGLDRRGTRIFVDLLDEGIYHRTHLPGIKMETCGVFFTFTLS